MTIVEAIYRLIDEQLSPYYIMTEDNLIRFIVGTKVFEPTEDSLKRIGRSAEKSRESFNYDCCNPKFNPDSIVQWIKERSDNNLKRLKLNKCTIGLRVVIIDDAPKMACVYDYDSPAYPELNMIGSGGPITKIYQSSFVYVKVRSPRYPTSEVQIWPWNLMKESDYNGQIRT